MQESLTEMMKWFQNGFSGNHFFILYIICLIYLAVTDRKLRVKIVIPSALLTVFILNPVCYRYLWAPTIGYSYWRLFWTIPVILVIALTGIKIIEKFRRPILKAAATLVFVSLLFVSGRIVYSNPDTSFSASENIFHLPNEAVIISNELVSLKDHPRVIANSSLTPYLRQVNPEIRMAFGRWGRGRDQSRTGYYFYSYFGEADITTENEKENKFNWTEAMRLCRLESYDYLILPETQKTADAGGDPVLLEAGFIFTEHIAGYSIYSCK